MPDHVLETRALPVALTGLIGRENAVVAVLDRLAGHRLVTLVGPGGAGKTRVALAVAAGLAPRPLLWVELAARADAATVPRALAEQLDVRDVPGRTLLESVAAALGEDEWVLVLDNGEHLLPDLAGLVRVLLERCPRTRVLATSRQRIGVAGEAVWEVPPLSPAESVELFCARAQAVSDGFAPDAAAIDAIARICAGLDGLPLAIELAAARVRMLSVADIADALDDRLAMSAAGDAVDRHRSLRAVLDWSHRLLDEPERRLLAELSVFTGTFGLDAARAVRSGTDRTDGGDVVEVVGRLVDRCLVTVTVVGARTRYVLSETVRMYAAEQLERGGGRAETQRRFVAWCVEFAEKADAEVRLAAAADALDRIEAERANLNAAMRLSLAAGGTVEDAARIAAGVWRFCALRGLYGEGRAVLDAALDTARPDLPPRLRAQALLGSGRLAALQCDYGQAVARLEAAGAVYGQLEDLGGVAIALNYLGSVARERGEYAAARELHAHGRELWARLGDDAGMALATHYLCLLAWLSGDTHGGATLGEDALARYRRLGDTEGIAGSLINLGACAVYGEDREQAAALLGEALGHSRNSGHREGVAWSLDLMGVLALRGGELGRADALLRESLAVHWSLGDRWRTASVLETLAAVAARSGDTDRAARVLAAAQAIRGEVGTPTPPVERRLRDDTLIRTAGAAAALRLGRLAGVPHVVEELLGASSRPTSGAGSRVDVVALGGLRIVVDAAAQDASSFGYAKPRELLVFLLDRPDATKEQIGAALWPWATPARLRGSFHTTLHHLRAALPPDRVLFARGRYRFDRGQPYSYDVEEFEALLAGPADATQLEAAAGLYRGDFLEDLAGERWIDERRDELRRAFDRTLSRLAALRADAGEYDEAIDLLHRVVARDPLRESAHRDLMRYYAASGHRGSALRQFVTLRDLLRAELDAQPEEETAALHARIRSGSRVSAR